jgi:hypothetical protein
MPPIHDVSRDNSKRTAAYWVLGGAAAGAVVAGTFLTLALVKRSELAAVCPGHICAPQYASDVSRLGVYSDLTTGGLAVAAAGLAIGGFLLATSSAPKNDAKARSRSPVDVRFSLGPVRALSLEGVF